MTESICLLVLTRAADLTWCALPLKLILEFSSVLKMLAKGAVIGLCLNGEATSGVPSRYQALRSVLNIYEIVIIQCLLME